MNYFDEYTKSYDMTKPELEYKYHHSYRVMDNMIVLAKSLSLPIKDVNLAKCIGLLHDIGRFEQFKKYQTFKDIDMDHGDYGEKILRENDALKYPTANHPLHDSWFAALKKGRSSALSAIHWL